MLLLVAVLLFCGTLAIFTGFLDTTPSVAADSKSALAANQPPVDQQPVRVIVPFTPNTNPSAR